MRWKVTLRSHDFVTVEIDAPADAPDEVLRNRVFDEIEAGRAAWDTDFCETIAYPLWAEIPGREALTAGGEVE